MTKNKEILLEKSQLTSESKYSYCYICLDRFKKAGKDHKGILQKLIYIKYLNVVQTKDGEHKEIDDYYLCPSCKAHLTVEDFANRYTVRTDGSRWTKTIGDNNGTDMATRPI